MWRRPFRRATGRPEERREEWSLPGGGARCASQQTRGASPSRRPARRSPATGRAGAADRATALLDEAARQRPDDRLLQRVLRCLMPGRTSGGGEAGRSRAWSTCGLSAPYEPGISGPRPRALGQARRGTAPSPRTSWPCGRRRRPRHPAVPRAKGGLSAASRPLTPVKAESRRFPPGESS